MTSAPQPNRRRTTVAMTLALPAIALTLLLGGCGGSSSSSASSPRVATLYAGGNNSQGVAVLDIAANGSLRLRENFVPDGALIDTRALAASADGTRLLTGSRSSTGMQVFFTDAATGELTDHDINRNIRNLDLTPHPALNVFYASRSSGFGTLHAVALQDIGTPSEALVEIDEYDTGHNISTSKIHPSGDYIFVSYVDNTPDPSEPRISMLALDSNGEFAAPEVDNLLISSVFNSRLRAISPAGDMLIATSSNSGSSVGFVAVDTSAETLTLMDNGPLFGQYRGAVFHPDGDWAYAVTSAGVITAYAIDRNAEEVTQIGENLSGPPLDTGTGVLAISPDGTTLFSALGENMADDIPGRIAVIAIDQDDGSLTLRNTVDMHLDSTISLLTAVTDLGEE